MLIKGLIATSKGLFFVFFNVILLCSFYVFTHYYSNYNAFLVCRLVTLQFM